MYLFIVANLSIYVFVEDKVHQCISFIGTFVNFFSKIAFRGFFQIKNLIFQAITSVSYIFTLSGTTWI